jgi:Ser/Thr protein kinase RdoA (MazF antagonist)
VKRESVNEAAKTHGLDGSLVEPDWPSLTLAELRSVLKSFPEAASPVTIVSTSPRPFSAASVIETECGRIFVKRHARSVRDGEGLTEEHLFMAHLRSNGIAVPRVLATDSAETALESGDWTYEVHGIPNGVDLYEDAISWTPFQSTEHARSAGEMLARMHAAAENYKAPARKVQPLVASFSIFAAKDPSQALGRYLNARHAIELNPATHSDSAEALALLAPFHDELKPLLGALPSLWTHNDLHASNLFWSNRTSNARATAAIDFGLADRTNAVYDLAQAIERNVVDWLELVRNPGAGVSVSVHLDQLWALLDGYESARRLSSEEANALAPMVALGHAEFALTEADYFLGVLHSPEKARIATRDYLVGHAKWFRNAGSEELLDPLRRWAETHARQAART